MDVILWSVTVLSSVAALSFWYIYPEKPWFAMLSLLVTAAAWWLHGASYILYLLPIALIAPVLFLLLAKSADANPRAAGEGAKPGIGAIAMYVLGAIPAILWFTFALRGMPDALKLRPSDSPAPEASMTEVFADLKLHPEGWLLFAPVLLLFAYAIARSILNRKASQES